MLKGQENKTDGSFLDNIKTFLLQLPRNKKRIIVMSGDFVVLSFVLAVFIWLRMHVLPGFEIPDRLALAMLAILPLLSVAVFRISGVYGLATRHVGRRGFWLIGASLLVSVALWSFLVFIADLRGYLLPLPRTVVVSYFLFGWAAVLFLRRFANWWFSDRPFNFRTFNDKGRKSVLIYGAGDRGVALLRSLQESGQFRVCGFIDDDPSLQGMRVHGLKVYSPEKLKWLIEREGIGEVIVSVASPYGRKRRRIIQKLEKYSIRVRVLPDSLDVITGRVKISALRDVRIEDLLGRDPVPPKPELMCADTTGKSVMITGAGGSIGSEIVRQIYALNPSRLILLELSEYALYRIRLELEERLAGLEVNDKSLKLPQIISVLGSAGDDSLIRALMKEHGIQTIYHTAAYKHIPLLEENVIAAIENNVFATATLARAAQECGVERMVLISSDKAVRPANVKGATNRVQELILQAMAQEYPQGTVFTAVRFGNVLDSSGSVVPRFREQIAKGGPVTVTHPEAKRYFMSITEAAQLVIQAGAMAETGQLFALDMGEPVKIVDLARKMIHLSGLQVADENDPNGDIEIRFIGLRDGDKIEEELLINGKSEATQHPRIRRLAEPHALTPHQVWRLLQQLKDAVRKRDIQAIRDVLQRHVEGYGNSKEDTLPVAVRQNAENALH